MPLINSPTLIRSFALVHLTVAYYLLADPAKIIHHNFVTVLGASMGLPPLPPHQPPLPPPLQPQPTSVPTTPLAAALLTLLALTDLLATTLPEELYSYYWSSQTPIRLLFFFVVTFTSYIANPSASSLRAFGPRAARGHAGAGGFTGAVGEGVGGVGMGGSGAGGGAGGGGYGMGGLGALSNGLVFAWGFVEMVWWFWVFVTLRDERREMSARKGAERDRKREEDGMLRL